jgi:hypothetical protein
VGERRVQATGIFDVAVLKTTTSTLVGGENPNFIMRRSCRSGLVAFLSQTPMTNWYYYDADGQKLGPIRGRDLSAFAKNGTVTPETVVENEQGKKGKAGQVQGLEFPQQSVPSVSPKPAANFYYYDKNGTRFGPVPSAVLKQLAENGVITPDTIIENEAGNTLKAGNAKGLTFRPTQPVSPPPVATPVSANPFAALNATMDNNFSETNTALPLPVSPVLPPVAVPPVNCANSAAARPTTAMSLDNWKDLLSTKTTTLAESKQKCGLLQKFGLCSLGIDAVIFFLVAGASQNGAFPPAGIVIIGIFSLPTLVFFCWAMGEWGGRGEVCPECEKLNAGEVIREESLGKTKKMETRTKEASRIKHSSGGADTVITRQCEVPVTEHHIRRYHRCKFCQHNWTDTTSYTTDGWED